VTSYNKEEDEAYKAKKARSLTRGTARFRSICEVHREIQDLVFELKIPVDMKELILTKAQEAYEMAKRMNNKLFEYKYDITSREWKNKKHESSIRGEIKFHRLKRFTGQKKDNPYLSGEDYDNPYKRELEEIRRRRKKEETAINKSG